MGMTIIISIHRWVDGQIESIQPSLGINIERVDYISERIGAYYGSEVWETLASITCEDFPERSWSFGIDEAKEFIRQVREEDLTDHEPTKIELKRIADDLVKEIEEDEDWFYVSLWY